MFLFKRIVTLLFLFLCACKADLDNDSLATLYTKPGFDSGTRPHINSIRHPNQYYPNRTQTPQHYGQIPQEAVPIVPFAQPSPIPQQQYYPAPTQPQAPMPVAPYAMQPPGQQAPEIAIPTQPQQQVPPMSRTYSNPYAIPPSYYQGYDSDKYYILPNYYNSGEPYRSPNGNR